MSQKPNQKVRTRFAPSPTGLLHVGGARTAAFSYFFAKASGGDFLLRIEDTDLERSKEEHVAEILASLEWLGLHSDEPPLFQARRADRHREVAAKLLAEGKAYKCYCTPQDIEAMRAQAESEARVYRYDRRWRERSDGVEGQPYAVRFKMPLDGETVVKDGVKGDVVFPNAELEDFVILRSDGSPTYMLAVAVDDLDMGITHVIRGDDHLTNTPKQLLLIKAMGGVAPNYASLPMILGADKAKLSKRHGAVAVSHYRTGGYLPEAMLNALIRLGWSHGDDEFFTADEIRVKFGLEGCGVSPSVFELERLNHLNQHHMRAASTERLVKILREDFHFDANTILERGGEKIFRAFVERATLLSDIPKLATWLISDKVEVADDESRKVLAETSAETLGALRAEVGALAESAFSEAEFFNQIKEVAKKLTLKVPVVMRPLRVLLTGTLQSPDMGLVAEALGKKRVLERLSATL
ncbi:MAG TPA: glutamate--tRNA ligase [Bdellovibrionota bacterium]|jgi:glutamyl-tRNA synthetase|nr:glutamate--tRNA ligase [Bdellovibrionota bacterium]